MRITTSVQYQSNDPPQSTPSDHAVQGLGVRGDGQRTPLMRLIAHGALIAACDVDDEISPRRPYRRATFGQDRPGFRTRDVAPRRSSVKRSPGAAALFPLLHPVRLDTIAAVGQVIAHTVKGGHYVGRKGF